MTNQSFLTFNLHGLLLAVDTKVVREIIWLPELALIEECPSFIAGVVNMRGKIVPIMDLNLRFGHAPRKYGYLDRVIVLSVLDFGSGILNSQSKATDQIPSKIQNPKSKIDTLGIIVNEVLDVMDIPEEDIELPPFEGREIEPHPHFVSGEAKAGEGIIMILNPRIILDFEFEIKEPEIGGTEIIPQSAISYFCPEADQREKEIFHNRAVNLQQVFDSEDSAKLISVAVISLNNEYLCVELESVREFSKIHNFTPVPCCPEHIAGNMNLRGNVLTVVDIRGLLNMQVGNISESTKVIVADTGEFPVGILVDDILDVINLRELDIVEVPSSISPLSEKFVKGTAPYGGRMLALLDLKKILAWDGLIVNEEV
ncbi:MAG: chemotaxis protein CheW [Nitrospirae bacterium]|nr:chemotaxis protein CheW [Nitrospirota bacterium]